MMLAVLALCIGLFCVAFAFPSYVAWRNDHPQFWLIVLVNCLFGNYFPCWLFALAWATLGRDWLKPRE